VQWRIVTLVIGSVVIIGLVAVLSPSRSTRVPARGGNPDPPRGAYAPRRSFDTSGANFVYDLAPAWGPSASLAEIAEIWRDIGDRHLQAVDDLALAGPQERMNAHMSNALLLNFEGRPREALSELEAARTIVESDPRLSAEWLYTVIYFQGATALRCGENENCIMCRGESSCILPIAPAAVHTNRSGSQAAVGFFTEYLAQFPDDLGARWLLNLAHMTLGEHPDGVDPGYRMDVAPAGDAAVTIGRFRDIGERVGVNRLNLAGGGIMDDFDRDGLLDLVTTSMDPCQSMAWFRNRDGDTFEDRTAAAGCSDQLGGLYCVQTDYNDDGLLDVYIPRGAWLRSPVRPTLLQNCGDGTFLDVTRDAGLLDPVNSITAAWADMDNDGHVDLYVCCERQPNRLFRNRGNGTFEEIARQAGAAGTGSPACKGAAWGDYDNDGDPDLFVTCYGGAAQLLFNNGAGTFEDVTQRLGIDGPERGFSCWSWDFDNDGWLDIFATSYDLTLDDVVRGILGRPHSRYSNRLYRNREGRGFEDRTAAAGLDLVFGTMGSNFCDFDNDGWLDMYLGTGDPRIDTLIPNRMFRNMQGERFAEITTSARTGHLQKGHSVACGDWDRDGDNDLFIEMGGAVPGDPAHNILFENPGHGNHSLTIRLIGTHSTRSANGVRITLVTAGSDRKSICRTIGSGGSFGANPYEATIGLGRSTRIASLEVYWPASGARHVVHDVPADQPIVLTEAGPPPFTLHSAPPTTPD
jgi:hypothetical protein